MPVTGMGMREDDRDKLPLDFIEPLAETIINALWDVDKEKLNSLYHSFMSHVGINNAIEVELVPHKERWDSMCEVRLKMEFMGKEYSVVRGTSCYYRDRPEFAEDSHRGASFINEVWWIIGMFTNSVFEEYTYSDVDTVRLYRDGLFKAAKVPAYDYSLEAEKVKYL